MRNFYTLCLEGIVSHREEILKILQDSNLRFETSRQFVKVLDKEFYYERWLHPYQGSWEVESLFTEQVLRNLSKIIKPDTTVIDIGAQTGYMSVAYSLFADKVISFEPNPAAYEVLEANARINTNILPYNFAISDTEGVLEFHYSDPGLCNGGYASSTDYGIGVTGHKVPLDVIAVDLNYFLDYLNFKDKISLIKIDAEGHDKDIIKSIRPLIELHRPVLITEIYDGLTSSETRDLLDTVYSLGYKAYDEKTNMLDIDRLGPEIRTIADITQGSGHNLICVYDTKYTTLR